jgi:hypothetical protein
MSPTAKLLCLFRWTLFDPETGTPLLATTPREKDFQMQWMDVQYAGATDDELIQWAREAWWYIWMRQAAVNYVGLWKRRFVREDDKKAKAAQSLEDDVGSSEKVLGTGVVFDRDGEKMGKIKSRLARLNEGLTPLA